MAGSPSHVWPSPALARAPRRFPDLGRLAALIAAVGAAAYFLQGYAPLGLAYYRARIVTEAFAASIDAVPVSPARIGAFREQLQRETGVLVHPGDVRVRRHGSGRPTVQLDLKIPLSFPLLGSGRAVHLVIAAGPRGEVP